MDPVLAMLAREHRAGRGRLFFKTTVPWQEAFWDDNSAEKYALCGNGAGKTFVGAVEAVRTLTGMNGAPVPCKLLVVSRNYRTQNDVIQPELYKVMPTWLYDGPAPGTHGWSGNRITLKNGSEIFFRSNESDEAIESMTVDAYWHDEPPSKASFDAASSRLRNTEWGRSWLTFTVTKTSHRWLEKELEHWSRHWVPSTPENLPFRTREDVERQMNKHSEAVNRNRIYAAWDVVSETRRLSNYDPMNDVKVLDQLDQRKWYFSLSFDYGVSARKDAICLIAWRPNVNAEGVRKPIMHVLLGETIPGTPSPKQIADFVRSELSDLAIPLKYIDIAVGDHNNSGRGFGSTKLNDEVGKYLGLTIRNAHKGDGSIERGLHLANIAFAEERLSIDGFADNTGVHPAADVLELERAIGSYDGDKKDVNMDVLDAFRYCVVATEERCRALSSADRIKID